MAPASECDLHAPPDQPFEVPLAADGVRVMVEVWLEGASATWAETTLAAAVNANIPVTVMIPAGPVPDALVPSLGLVKEHDVLSLGFVLPASAVPQNLSTSVRPLRKSLQPAQKLAGRSRTVVAPIGSRGAEAMLGRVGFRELVNATSPPQAGSRYAGILEGMQRINVVFPGGPYQGPCGPDPRVGPFTPRAADRAARAIQQASAVPGAPVVRVALVGAQGANTDGDVLARWVREVIEPGGATVTSARQARIAVLQALRQNIDMSHAVGAVGRVVSLEDTQRAAEALLGEAVIPRTLPGDLTPSEAFFAFTLVLAGRDDGTAVRIRGLSGPSSDARSILTGPVDLSPASVRDTALALQAAMPREIPSAMPIDGRLLTAGEVLLAFASAVRGDEPVVTRPIAVPDPNARGLGWGVATP